MPQYLFRNTQTDEIHSVFYHMNDEKDYRGPEGTAAPGLWIREWTKPQAAIDTAVDPYSAKDYIKATAKRGTIGDLWDRSAELRAKREDKEGKGNDPIQKAFYEDYSRKRKGKKHPQQAREEGQKALADKGIRVDFGDD